jgi:hypothetical protein
LVQQLGRRLVASEAGLRQSLDATLVGVVRDFVLLLEGAELLARD